ncbi:hypothetical protein CIW48_25705 [Methylobacterium sp. P1-11]|nr:hypothetical protein CIW48_25705 [Methylobacterium sp. P1-11]
MPCAGASGAGSYARLLIPQAVEGPFCRDLRLVPADIRQDRPGIPLLLARRVVEAANCAPLPGRRIDVWHCDAEGR